MEKIKTMNFYIHGLCFLSQSSPLCDNGEKATVIRLTLRIDGLFDGNKICQLFHRFPLQLQRRMNISIHCDGNR